MNDDHKTRPLSKSELKRIAAQKGEPYPFEATTCGPPRCSHGRAQNEVCIACQQQEPTCDTHHNACACREAYFAKLEAELKTTKEFYEDCKQSRLSACERAERLEARLKTAADAERVVAWIEEPSKSCELARKERDEAKAKEKIAEGRGYEEKCEPSEVWIARTALAELRKA